MKKNLLALLFFVFTLTQSIAQDFRGVSPAGLSGYVPSHFDFVTSAGGWGTPDMLIPANSVTGTMVLVDDGTAADSLGCNALINGSSVNGKIAVLYRGTCAFTQKAQNAQNAGAIAIIIINNTIGAYPSGNGSLSVTIPIVMISNSDGAYLRSFIDNGNGVVFLGTPPAGTNNLRINKSQFGMLRPAWGDTADYYFIPQSQIQPILMGTEIINRGSNTQNSIILNANVNSGLFNSNGNLTSLVTDDTTDLFSSSSFTPPGIGTYNVTYNLSSSLADVDPLDNSFSETFYVTDTVFGLDNGIPDGQYRWFNYWGASNSYEVYSPQLATSISFMVGSATTSQNISVEIYEVDLSSGYLMWLGSGEYTLSSSEIANNSLVTVRLSESLLLEPGKFYLVGVSDFGGNGLYIWHDSNKIHELQSYVIDNNQQNFFYLPENYYTGNPIIRLNFGCPTIPFPSTYNFISATCNGVCNGQFNSSFSAPYSYYFDLYDAGNNFLSSQGPYNGSQTVTFNGLCAGNYYVKVRADIPSCNAESTGSLATISNAGVINGFSGTATDASTCSNNNGQIQVSFIGNGAFSNPNISWSGASTGSSNSISSPYTISNLLPGNYTISFTSSSNSSCAAIDTQTFLGTSVLNQEICAVTVDSATASYNVIVWEKPTILGIDSFYVYREISANIYERIGAVAYEDSSVFEDLTSNPNQQSWKYKLSVIDDCGSEGNKGDYHESIHLQYGSNGNFNWNHYGIENISNPVLNYIFLKDDLNTGNWLTIGSPVNNSFTDVNYASTPNPAYRVYVNWNISCTPSRAGVNTSRSNIKNTSGINSLTESSLESVIQIYPNPAISTVQINTGDNLISTVNILDASGRLIKIETINSFAFELNIEDLESGIYFIEFNSSFGKTTRKITKQ